MPSFVRHYPLTLSVAPSASEGRSRRVVATFALALLACGPSRSPSPTVELGGGSGGPNPSACAATYAEVPQGQPCGDEPFACGYPQGNCTCASQRYCGGPPPPQELLDQLAIPVWQCKPFRTDGCPEVSPSGTCSQEGKVCTYDDCCFREVTCQDGTWTETREACPP